MAEVKSQEEGLESILSFYIYCNTHRNDVGFWEQVFEFNEPPPDSMTNYRTCPEGRQDHFTDEYVPLNDKKRSTAREEILSENRDVSGWILVNNKGCLFGDYDKEQRL
jgi:hypothetical protein